MYRTPASEVSSVILCGNSVDFPRQPDFVQVLYGDYTVNGGRLTFPPPPPPPPMLCSEWNHRGEFESDCGGEKASGRGVAKSSSWKVLFTTERSFIPPPAGLSVMA